MRILFNLHLPASIEESLQPLGGATGGFAQFAPSLVHRHPCCPVSEGRAGNASILFYSTIFSVGTMGGFIWLTG
jgi:hypothetical protein